MVMQASRCGQILAIRKREDSSRQIKPGRGIRRWSGWLQPGQLVRLGDMVGKVAFLQTRRRYVFGSGGSKLLD